MKFYSALPAEAEGYDPHWQPTSPYGKHFDRVTMMYVVNVIDDHDGRVRALRSAASSLDPSGAMVVVARA